MTNSTQKNAVGAVRIQTAIYNGNLITAAAEKQAADTIERAKAKAAGIIGDANAQRESLRDHFRRQIRKIEVELGI